MSNSFWVDCSSWPNHKLFLAMYIIIKYIVAVNSQRLYNGWIAQFSITNITKVINKWIKLRFRWNTRHHRWENGQTDYSSVVKLMTITKWLVYFQSQTFPSPIGKWEKHHLLSFSLFSPRCYALCSSHKLLHSISPAKKLLYIIWRRRWYFFLLYKLRIFVAFSKFYAYVSICCLRKWNDFQKKTFDT